MAEYSKTRESALEMIRQQIEQTPELKAKLDQLPQEKQEEVIEEILDTVVVDAALGLIPGQPFRRPK